MNGEVIWQACDSPLSKELHATNICEKGPSSIRCWGLNPQHSGHESRQITTGLNEFAQTWKICLILKTDDRSYQWYFPNGPTSLWIRFLIANAKIKYFSPLKLFFDALCYWKYFFHYYEPTTYQVYKAQSRYRVNYYLRNEAQVNGYYKSKYFFQNRLHPKWVLIKKRKLRKQNFLSRNIIIYKENMCT